MSFSAGGGPVFSSCPNNYSWVGKETKRGGEMRGGGETEAVKQENRSLCRQRRTWVAGVGDMKVVLLKKVERERGWEDEEDEGNHSALKSPALISLTSVMTASRPP